MRAFPRYLTLAAAVFLPVALLAAPKKEPGPETVVKPKELSLVRVNVTGQPYDYVRPWQKRAPFTKRALGAVLPQGRVLVTADLVANQNYVELERAESGEKTAANVVVIDYESNLALLEPAEQKFLEGLVPLQLALDTVVGDRLAAWQLESTGALVVTEGLVTTIQMTRYPADLGQFLTYRISISMQYRDNSYTVPLVKNNKLAGLLLRFAFSKGRREEPLPGLSGGWVWILPDAGPATAEVCRTNRETRRGLCDERRPEFAGGESRLAGRRHCDWDREQRDRSKWELCRSALRED
jgi:hypothetical protein